MHSSFGIFKMKTIRIRKHKYSWNCKDICVIPNGEIYTQRISAACYPPKAIVASRFFSVIYNSACNPLLILFVYVIRIKYALQNITVAISLIYLLKLLMLCYLFTSVCVWVLSTVGTYRSPVHWINQLTELLTSQWNDIHF